MRLFGMLLLLPCISIAQGHTFRDQRCDFAVTFPVPFERKAVFKGPDEGIFVTARPNKSVKLSAECWPKESISTRDFVRHIQEGAQKQGIEVTAVTIERKSVGEVVTLVGRMLVQGQTVHLRSVSYFGPRYRLDLRVLDYSPSGSREQIDFRNSVTPTW